MFTFIRTTSDNLDFKKLTQIFDNYLVDIDGDEKDFFAEYNHVYFNHVIVCYEDEKAIACGAFKEYQSKVAEIKRMFVLPEYRSKGIATSILNELENWAKIADYETCILETSIRLESAIALYRKNGYVVFPNYRQYIGVESSICMSKNIK
jgi:GNAT superfamily N-acetyltransferase